MHRELLAFRRTCFHNHADQRPVYRHIIRTAANHIRDIHHVKHMACAIIRRHNRAVRIHNHNAVGGQQACIISIIARRLAQIAQKLERLGNNDFILRRAFKADCTIAASPAVTQRKNIQAVEHAQRPLTLAGYRNVLLQHTRHQRLLHRAHAASRKVRTSVAHLRHGLLLLIYVNKLFIFCWQINCNSRMGNICCQPQRLLHCL